MTAIVYRSNTGFTAQYATILAKKLGLPAWEWEQARKQVPSGSEIIYMGWLCVGTVRGYKKAAKQYQIAALAMVGMGSANQPQTEKTREQQHLPASLPLFYLQGGFAQDKLHGIYKLMMGMMGKSVVKNLREKPDLTPDEREMLALWQHGGSFVSEENLVELIAWYKNRA